MNPDKPYISIDPGVGTGVSVWLPSTGFNTWESYSLQDVADDVRDFKEDWPDGIIVTEKFTISSATTKGKVFYESVYFNGWLSIEYPERIEQTAQQGGIKSGRVKPAIKRQLVHLGWQRNTKDGHSDSASAHLLYRAVKNRDKLLIARLAELG